MLHEHLSLRAQHYHSRLVAGCMPGSCINLRRVLFRTASALWRR